MSNKLAENIREHRKANGFTQEELAERLGITLGTISKWERGSSEPDIDYIMDLAEIFRVSVDVLIGFNMKGNNADDEVERIEELVSERRLEEAAEEYERALIKFPNNFKIVYGAATAYDRVGTVLGKHEALDRAIELYRHALDLFSQNNNPEITEVDIRNQIAGCFSHKEDYEKAYEEYKKNNICGMNNHLIGSLMVNHMKENKEGIHYVTGAFLDSFSKEITVMSSYVTYYRNQKNIEMCIKAAEWTLSILKSLKVEQDKLSFLDKIISVQYLILGMAHDWNGESEKGREYTRMAIKLAREFDANPCYSLENVMFTESIKGGNVYDDMGETAEKGLVKILEEQAKEDISEEFKKMFYEELG